MALFNEILVGRYNRFLQKLLGMKGGPPAAQLANEIGAQIQFFSGVENRILESWFLYGIGLVRSSASIEQFRLRNPANSGVIGVVTMLASRGSVTSGIVVSYVPVSSLGDLTTNEVANVQNMDARGKSLPSLILSSGQAGAPLAGFAIIQASSVVGSGVINRDNFITTQNQEIVIAPGGFLQVDTTAAGNNLLVDIWWRERALEESELKA